MVARRWRSRSKGQGLVEYSLILLFVALVVFIVLQAIGPILINSYQSVVDAFP